MEMLMIGLACGLVPFFLLLMYSRYRRHQEVFSFDSGQDIQVEETLWLNSSTKVVAISYKSNTILLAVSPNGAESLGNYPVESDKVSNISPIEKDAQFFEATRKKTRVASYKPITKDVKENKEQYIDYRENRSSIIKELNGL